MRLEKWWLKKEKFWIYHVTAFLLSKRQKMTLPQDGTLSVNTAEGYTEYDPVKN
jgi:hypothetical protein